MPVPELDQAAMEAAAARQGRLTKPAGSLGGLVMMLFTGPYRVGKTRFKNQAVYTNTMGRGPYRGPWMMESMAREAMVDIVAQIGRAHV